MNFRVACTRKAKLMAVGFWGGGVGEVGGWVDEGGDALRTKIDGYDGANGEGNDWVAPGNAEGDEEADGGEGGGNEGDAAAGLDPRWGCGWVGGWVGE